MKGKRMGHGSRNWQRKWAVDLAARSATHTSGAVVDFAFIGQIPPGGTLDDLDIAAPPKIGCVSIEDDGRVWIGELRGGEEAAITLDFRIYSHITPIQRVARLMREAGDIYKRALERGGWPPVHEKTTLH